MSSLVRVEIDGKAPEHNLKQMRKESTSGTQACAVVKSNASPELTSRTKWSCWGARAMSGSALFSREKWCESRQPCSASRSTPALVRTAPCQRSGRFLNRSP